MVEVSVGGMDYTNPDALSPKYPGEMEEYDSPVEAVQVAIRICEQWRDDEPEAEIGVGSTLGMTMPFEPRTFAEAIAWAERQLAALPKCSRCGELLPQKYFHVSELDDEKFCREFCAEEAYNKSMKYQLTEGEEEI